MKNRSEIGEIILSFIIDDLAAATRDELDLEDNILTEGYLDSISIMRLIAHIEARLSVKIPPRDLIPANFISVSAMASYLSSIQQQVQ